jgi:hypothetical protein
VAPFQTLVRDEKITETNTLAYFAEVCECRIKRFKTPTPDEADYDEDEGAADHSVRNPGDFLMSFFYHYMVHLLQALSMAKTAKCCLYTYKFAQGCTNICSGFFLSLSFF